MTSFVDFLDWLDGLLWGLPFIVFVMIIGLYFTLRSGFFPFRRFGHIMKHTLMSIRNKEANDTKKGQVSPFQAACIAIGGSVGTANISGVATALATGGPGAVFWMWLWAFFGMMVKLVETALGVFYRSKDENGDFYGGSMYFMERGIRGGKGKVGVVFATIFSAFFFVQFLQGSQCYTIAEVLNTSFGLDMMLVTVLYTLFVYVIIWSGTPRIAKAAAKLVPFMCLLFLLGGLIMIAVNISAFPAVLASIFTNAFTGSAAFGGFVGATVAKAMRSGVSRSIYSNEAGMGSSPLVHGSADTIHPVRQGLWGSFEVFVDTIVVCTITAFAVLCSGTLGSGAAGATLTILSFETVFGRFGVMFIGVMTVLFGATTTMGWFTYYQAALSYLTRKWPSFKKTAMVIFKCVFPLTNVAIVSYIVYTGNGAELLWTIISILTAPSTFINLFALFLVRGKFFELFKDYKARHMGIGTVDPNMHVFYEDGLGAAPQAARETAGGSAD